MDIIRAEARKLLADKVIIMMIFFAVIANVSIIMSGSLYRSDIKYINNVIAQTGAKATNESIASGRNILNKDYDALKNEFSDLFGYFPESIDEIYKYMPHRAKACQNYMALFYMLEGTESQSKNGEGDIYFSSESIAFAEDLLYSKLLFCIYTELSIVGVFAVFKSMGYEFVKATHHCLYSCKIGRRLQGMKFVSCSIFVSVAYILTCLLCLTVYFSLFPQSSFLSSPLCSVNIRAAASERSFTVLGYLLAHIGVGYAVVIIYLLTAYIFVLLIKNQYVSMTAFMASQAILLAGAASEADFCKIFSYTPVTLLMSLNKNVSANTEKWLLNAEGVFASESFVIQVLVIWVVIGVIGAAVSNVVFRRRDI